MHRFHHSRGRILFEVLCALVIAASFIGAWMQTGASALLPAAFAAALYALWHATDMKVRKPAVVGDARNPALAIVAEVDLPECLDSTKPETSVDKQPEVSVSGKKAAPAKPKAPKKPKVTKAVEEARPPEPEFPQVAERTHYEPLFEPEPFVRQIRPAFGRKAG